MRPKLTTRRLALLLLVFAASVVTTGVAVALLLRPYYPHKAHWFEIGGSILIASIYSLVMSGTMGLTGTLAFRRVPLRSPRAVALHVAIQAAAALVSFTAATLLCSVLFGTYYEPDLTHLLIVGGVAMTASLIGCTLIYLYVFYRRSQQAEQAALHAELKALRAQVNPHFLFNALNSIAALIRTRPAEAETVTEDLADLFRYSLKASQQPSVTLAEELKSVQLYLAVERARFRDRLATVFDVPDAVRDAAVPSLLLQPLVENAVKHGASQTMERCLVTVGATLEDGTVHISVTDTGPGFDTTDEAVLLARGAGLANVWSRLQLFFDDARLTLQPDGVTLSFPYRGETGRRGIGASGSRRNGESGKGREGVGEKGRGKATCSAFRSA